MRVRTHMLAVGRRAQIRAHEARVSPADPLVVERNAVVSLATVRHWERMRSGGRRGLQIRRSGASGVRGGFDSHAFPPLLTLWTVAMLVLGAGLAAAQGATARPDSTAKPDSTAGPDTSTTSPAAAEPPSTFEYVTTAGDSSDAEAERVLREAAEHRRERERSPQTVGRFDEPRWVMLRSALIPGWGQLHNGSWLKALLVAAGEVSLISGIWQNAKDLDNLSQLVDEAKADSNFVLSNYYVDKYNAVLDENTQKSWFLGGLLAYALADAYVDAHFKNFNVEFDPPKKGKGGSSARLRLRWSF